MSPELQSIVALIVVVVTVALLVARGWKKRRNPGCGGGCACPTEKLKR